MVQGTASGVGKSLLVAGLCRVLHRRGVSVAPFKPQNMSLNSAVSCDGGEIGRAQALQAQAAGLEPHSDMNPVLLKPHSERGAQVILGGRVYGAMEARAFHRFKAEAMPHVLAAFARLQEQHDFIVVEGAGSPAEINLREGDIANMGFAEAVDCPVLLVADIDRGGVFAQLAGTLALLSDSERARLQGLVINRFRGDETLLTPGLDWLREHTAKPLLGVLPFVEDLRLPPEDALAGGGRAQSGLRVVVPAPPRISNHSDFVPLQAHPQVDFVFARNAPLGADLLILAGSKSVRADLDWLRARGWDEAVRRHLRYGGRLIGICGGFQMLGQEVDDAHGREGAPGCSPGLGLLEFRSRIGEQKLLRRVGGHFAQQPQVPVRGYEIHAGRSSGAALRNPALILEGRRDGACSADGRIFGSYLHGLFDEAEALQWLLAWAGLQSSTCSSYHQRVEQDLNRLADTLEQKLQLQLLFPWL